MAESSGEKRWYELPILITVLGSILLLIGNVVIKSYADGWNGKAEILRKLGREDEADAALAKAKELEDSGYGHYSEWDDETLVVSIDYLPAV